MATSAAGKAAQASGYKTQYFPECSDTHPTMDTATLFTDFLVMCFPNRDCVTSFNAF